MFENDYDAFAAAYDADNENNAWNAYYERPAVLSLVGDVTGLRVLDAGCGGGAHAAALLDRGAILTGIDASAGLLEIAQRRLEGRAQLLLADLNELLPFDDGAFDLILASLVMQYLPDWSPPLSEFNRLLSQGGRPVFSTHPPFMDHQLAGRDNYFETYSFNETWQRGGKAIAMRLSFGSPVVLEKRKYFSYDRKLRRRVVPQNVPIRSGLTPTLLGTPIASGRF